MSQGDAERSTRVPPEDRFKIGMAAWKETAMQAQRNCDYYRGLIVQIGEMFGEEAYIQDDDGRSQDVLCSKVPDLVAKLISERTANPS